MSKVIDPVEEAKKLLMEENKKKQVFYSLYKEMT